MKHKRKKIGLALGGGGAKGFAHIGVIKVLEKNNVPIDFITGTSIGALVGGFYAASKSSDYLEQIASDSSVGKFISLMAEFTGGRGGIIGGEKVLNFLSEGLDGIDFKDLKIPFAVTVTNLNSGETEYFEKSGDVAQAIRASISYPPIFSPYKIKNKMYVDGGLSCQVPVSKARLMGADLVIAVNLEDEYVLNKKAFEKESIMTSAYNVFNSSIKILVKKVAEYDVENADFVLNLPVGKFKTWSDFGKAEELIKIGEEFAKENIKNIKKTLL